MDAQKCGEFITELRKEKNLTQKDLANELNVSDKAISRWETGKGFPDVESLQSLSKFFAVTINELLAGEKAEIKTIEEIAEENIISAIAETEKSKKTKKLSLAKRQTIIKNNLQIKRTLPIRVEFFLFSLF